MSKSEFLNELNKCLKGLDSKERSKFLNYYEELIEDYKEDGLSEEEAIQKIGSPASIADEIKSEKNSIVINLPSTKNKVINVILLILGFPLWGSLLLAAVLMVLSVYVIIWCLPIITGSLAAGTFVVSLVSIVGTPFFMFHNFAAGLAQFGIGIALIGISMISTYWTIILGKKFALLTKNVTSKIGGVFQKKVVRI